MLGLVENESLGDMEGYLYWWIGLNDVETEGTYKWPSAAEFEFSAWDVDYGEPYPGTIEHRTA